MFCPNCASEIGIEQKFCRSCGLNLEKTAESLLEQIPAGKTSELLNRERKLEKFGNVAFAGLGLVLLAGIGAIIYLILTKMILSGESVLFGILLIAFMIFAALSLIFVGFREDLKERKQKATPTLKNELPELQISPKFLEEKPFELLPSVTEATTASLYTRNKTRKFEKD